MSKLFVTEQEADTVIAAYREARAFAEDAEAAKDAARAVYIDAEENVIKAEADYKIAEAAVEEAFEAAANLYLGPKQEDDS